jgi:hypothetical protein
MSPITAPAPAAPRSSAPAFRHRLMHDLKRDLPTAWRQWTKAERVGACVIVLFLAGWSLIALIQS